MFALLRTQSGIRKNHVHGVHRSVNAARVGACATLTFPVTVAAPYNRVSGLSHRARHHGGDACSRRCAVRRADTTRRREFPHQRAPFPPILYPRARPDQERRRSRQWQARPDTRGSGRVHRKSGGRCCRRQIRRAIRGGHFPNRQRNLHQHERQRSDRPPRQSASQRSRQPRPIQQRRNSFSHPHRRRRHSNRRACCPPWRISGHL